MLAGVVAYIPLANMNVVGAIPFDVPFVFFNVTMNINHMYAAGILIVLFVLLYSSWHIHCRGVVKHVKRIATSIFVATLAPATLLMAWASYTPRFISVDAIGDSSSYRLVSLVDETFTHIFTKIYVIHGQIGVAKLTNISWSGYNHDTQNSKVYGRWVNGQAIVTVDNDTYYYRPGID